MSSLPEISSPVLACAQEMALQGQGRNYPNTQQQQLISWLLVRAPQVREIQQISRGMDPPATGLHSGVGNMTLLHRHLRFPVTSCFSSDTFPLSPSLYKIQVHKMCPLWALFLLFKQHIMYHTARWGG
ncbi:hypothetical protein KIL84_013552 [Mauremys mutica]|uniref:Uncharacterized protein n=1 Tax=Mauremys mutica TaxID=74926 RepID=A0A9D3WXM2_9SAUR|nr:hypothetical protein KIL84_013552 [Mauremys mutica]